MGVFDSIFRFLAGVPSKPKTEVEKVVPVVEETPKKTSRGRPSTKKTEALNSKEWPFPTAKATPAKKASSKKAATKTSTKTATKKTTKKTK